jgi:hypothetical protein
VAEHGGSVPAAAAALGIAVGTAYRVLRGAPDERPADRSRATALSASRARLLAAQAAAARTAVARGDRAGADRALAAVTAELSRLAATASDGYGA